MALTASPRGRGRGESGDTQPVALEREIEEIDARYRRAGEAHPNGISSGGALALEAAAALGEKVDGLRCTRSHTTAAPRASDAGMAIERGDRWHEGREAML